MCNTKAIVYLYVYVIRYSHAMNPNAKLKCQEEKEQLWGSGQMKDRNSPNLAVELGDNQRAMEAAQALRDSSLVLNRHNRGSIWVAGWVVSVGFSGCYAAVLHLFCCYFVLSVN